MADPSVVRNGHFGDIDLDPQTGETVPVERAAIVTGVGPIEDNGIVNLFVMINSSTFHRIGVHYSETLNANCWTWPPRS